MAKMRKSIAFIFAVILITLFFFLIYRWYDLFLQKPAELLPGLSPNFKDILPKEVIPPLYVLIMVLVLFNAVDSWVRSLVKMPEEEIRVLVSVVKYTILILGVIVFAFVSIKDISSLTVFSGLVGAGVALAIQQPILCFVGWLTIMISKTYKIGDRIGLNQVKGDVVDIKIIHTELVEIGNQSEQETGKIVLVPNSHVLTERITNYTARNPFIWDELTISVTYESDFDAAKDAIQKCAKKIVGEKMKNASYFLSLSKEYKMRFRELKNEPELFVSFAPSSIDISIRYLVEARSRRKISSKLTEEVFKTISKMPNVTIAYPHVEIITGKKSA